MNVVFKITYPNGKIYVGSDRKDCLMTFFGSGVLKYINDDPTLKKLKDFKIRKEILWESKTATRTELNRKKNDFIDKLGANDPKKGYNLRPPFAKK